ncbi:MAG: hypothetical protein OQK51_14660 [Kangiellaceae bacterium]|nr:hypothetical protein [Kangiellaceae bacterium]
MKSELGALLSNEECRKFHREFVEKFRVEFDKSKIETHGPIWANLIAHSGWIEISELDVNTFSECYVYYENGRDSCLFDSNLEKYIQYIEGCSSIERKPLYAVKKDLSTCVSWQAEDGNTEKHYVSVSTIT